MYFALEGGKGRGSWVEEGRELGKEGGRKTGETKVTANFRYHIVWLLSAYAYHPRLQGNMSLL